MSQICKEPSNLHIKWLEKTLARLKKVMKRDYDTKILVRTFQVGDGCVHSRHCNSKRKEQEAENSLERAGSYCGKIFKSSVSDPGKRKGFSSES